MFVPIQAPTAYQDSLLWDLHRQAYQQGGSEILLQDVPYNISSNPCLAQQMADVFLASLKPENTAPGLPSKISEIHILELGGGLGILALNFLKCLQEQAPEVLQRTTYWLSDYAATTLQELARHSAYQDWIQQGHLKLALIDGFNPEQAQDLEGHSIDLPAQGFQMIQAQYFFSTLPTKVVLKQGNQWYEQKVALNHLPLGPEPDVLAQQNYLHSLANLLKSDTLSQNISQNQPQYALFLALKEAQDLFADRLEQAQSLAMLSDEYGDDLYAFFRTELLNHWIQALETPSASEAVLESLGDALDEVLLKPLFKPGDYAPDRIQEHYGFAPTSAEALFAPEHHQTVLDLAVAESVLVIAYSPLSLECLQRLQTILHPEGLLFFGDKAYHSLEPQRQARSEQATRHGATMAHAVNFPLFDLSLQQAGFQVQRTHDSVNAMHHLLAVPKQAPKAAQMAAVFQEQFIQRARNEHSHALLEGGHALLRQERLEPALRALVRALNERPGDGTLQYLVALAHLNQEDYPAAIAVLERKHDDVFALLNRHILLAEAYRLTGQYAKALPIYVASLSYGDNALTRHHQALCHIELGQIAEACQELSRAKQLDPENEEVSILLAHIA